MNTQVAEKTTLKVEQAVSQGEVAIFERPRFAWHDAIAERYGPNGTEAKLGVTKSSWKTLVDQLFPNAKSVNSIIMLLAYCASRNLDPFKRVAHIVPMWDPKGGPNGRGAYVDTVWPGIAELRTTATRTDAYAGCDEVEFGPMMTKSFSGTKGTGQYAEEVSATVEFPEWARVTVYRIVKGVRCPFVGPKTYWLESYATIGATEVPNKMWQERPHGQVEKVAEAGALRRAFPEEIGNDYSAEEMEGKRVVDAAATAKDITPPKTAAPQAPPPQPTPAPVAPRRGGPPKTTEATTPPPKAEEKPPAPALEGEVIPPNAPPPANMADFSKAKPDPNDPKGNPVGFLAWADARGNMVEDAIAWQETWDNEIAPSAEQLTAEQQTVAWHIFLKHSDRLGGPAVG